MLHHKHESDTSTKVKSEEDEAEPFVKAEEKGDVAAAEAGAAAEVVAAEEAGAAEAVAAGIASSTVNKKFCLLTRAPALRPADYLCWYPCCLLVRPGEPSPACEMPRGPSSAATAPPPEAAAGGASQAGEPPVSSCAWIEAHRALSADSPLPESTGCPVVPVSQSQWATEQPAERPIASALATGRGVTGLCQKEIKRLLRQLNAGLVRAYRSKFPHWHTSGAGYNVPERRVHRFEIHCLKHGARIDMYRGSTKDDLQNCDWKVWLDQMADTWDFWRRHQNPSNLCQVANTMEISAGIAYAAACRGANLPADHSLIFSTKDSLDAWTDLWATFAALGLRPAGDCAPELTGVAARSLSSPRVATRKRASPVSLTARPTPRLRPRSRRCAAPVLPQGVDASLSGSNGRFRAAASGLRSRSSATLSPDRTSALAVLLRRRQVAAFGESFLLQWPPTRVIHGCGRRFWFTVVGVIRGSAVSNAAAGAVAAEVVGEEVAVVAEAVASTAVAVAARNISRSKGRVRVLILKLRRRPGQKRRTLV